MLYTTSVKGTERDHDWKALHLSSFLLFTLSDDTECFQNRTRETEILIGASLPRMSRLDLGSVWRENFFPQWSWIPRLYVYIAAIRAPFPLGQRQIDGVYLAGWFPRDAWCAPLLPRCIYAPFENQGFREMARVEWAWKLFPCLLCFRNLLEDSWGSDEI